MGHPVLRARARAIDVGEIKSARIQQLIDDMFETMTEYQGVGLAAPQVHESVRLFVAGFAPGADGDDDEEEERVPLMALINPEITVGRAGHGRRLGRLPQHPGHPRQGAARPPHRRCVPSIATASGSSCRPRASPRA